MIRLKEPERVRVDALRIGAEKAIAGCDACAEGYFALARQHGATERDIERALTAARRTAEQRELSRREFLKAAAVGAAGAAVAAGGGLLPQAAQGAAAATDGAQVAWVRARRTTAPTDPGDPFRLVGINPDGSGAGLIDPLRGEPLRAPDGGRLYVLWGQQDGAGSTTTVEVHDAATGALERTIAGQRLALTSPIDGDTLVPHLSADGRYLAVLHQTRRAKPGTLRQATQGGAYGIPLIRFPVADLVFTTSLEIIDLQAGGLVAFQELDASETTLPGGHALFAPDGRRLYVSTLDKQFNASLTVVGFVGGRLQVLARATNGQAGHTLPAAALSRRPTTRFGAAGLTLTRFDPMSRVRIFNLSALSLVNDLDIGLDRYSAKPYAPVGLFSPDGSTLYVANAGAGTIRSVDLVRGSATGPVTLPASTLGPGARPLPGAGTGTAALAPDGTRLYLVDGYAGTGLAVVRLPDLQATGRWLADQPLRAVWPTPDGQTVFVMTQDDAVASVRSDGSVAGALQIGTFGVDFVPAS